MELLAIALVALAIIGVGALIGSRWRGPDNDLAVSPLLLIGLPLAGAGAPLATTTPAAGFGLVAVGLVLVVAGAVRTVSSE